MKKPEVTAVVGGQWGDEGKGKIVDFLATKADVVIRAQGGDNAGHTVLNDKGKFGLHLVPAGIFNAQTLNIIGTGVALNPRTLMGELAELRKRGISFDNLVISPKAHLAFDYHLFIDRGQEVARGKNRIETTKRGIGPTYMDKAERIGLQARLLLDPERLRHELHSVLERKRHSLGSNADVLQPSYYDDLIDEAHAQLGPFIRDTAPLIDEHLAKGSRFVLEGAHGTLLDLDHGTYPMVTASNSTVGGLLVGAGLPPLRLTRVVGIFKAYQTRVGAGAMPTELHGPLADTVRDRGQEFGTTTGRPRRIGWFDGPAARYAHQINGFTDIAVTKIDTLADISGLEICTDYQEGGAPAEFATDNADLAHRTALLTAAEGWTAAELEKARTKAELPPAVRAYCDRIMQNFPGARLSFIGVGRAREQLITG